MECKSNLGEGNNISQSHSQIIAQDNENSQPIINEKKIKYVPYSIIYRIEPPYPDISYDKLNER